MKVYAYNITQSEKMVYLSCVRYIKENGKYSVIPYNVSVKKDVFTQNVKSLKFPVIFDVKFKKGIGAIVKPYEKEV